MVLDPLSAIGLAGNIVQFVDFSFKLVTETRNIYHSATGKTTDNVLLSAIADDIQKLSDRLETSQSARTSASIARLQSLAVEAQEVAEELLKAVSLLRASKPQSKWSSFKVALAQVYNGEKIRSLTSQITKLQGLVTNRLLDALWNQQSDIYKKLENLERKSNELAMHRTSEVSTLQQDISKAFERLNMSSQLEAMTIRDLLEKAEQQSEISQADISLLSKRMNDLATLLAQLSTRSKSVHYDQAVLQSLYFERMKFRYHNVPEAHAKTFEWIFEEKLASSDKPLQFTEWLRSESGIYWIMGKPGSGKSTLMKFICRHERSVKSLRIWAASKQLVCAEFFFWNAGSELQKSYEGLLRGLLFEVLRQCPSFIQLLWPNSDWNGHSDFVPRNWTRTTLLDSLKSLLQFEAMPTRFCFFIDGLDEYESAQEGDHSELVKILENLTTASDIKLCVSSRSWFVFRDAFGGNPKRYIKLEDLTREDIKSYVHSKFEENHRFRQLQSEDTAYTQLENEVVERAQGVFLWVYLVVQSLLRGITQADQVSTLQDRLRELPTHLDEYFQHMLDSVETVYRRHTAVGFQTCLAVDDPLTLMTFWFLDELETFDSSSKTSPITVKTALRRLDNMRRRLDGRTKGLLEARSRWDSDEEHSPFYAYEVDFLHRTARDFVRSRDVQQMLQPYVPSDFNPLMSILKALLAQMKALPISGLDRDDQGPFARLIDQLSAYGRLYERHSSLEVDELDKILIQAEKVAFDRPFQYIKGKRTGFVPFLVENHHFRYLRWRLEQKPTLIQSRQRVARARPVLDILCGPPFIGSSDIYGSQFSPVTEEYFGVILAILAAGESPNLRYKDCSTWARFLRDISNRHSAGFSIDKEMALGIVTLLIQNGADLSEMVKVDGIEIHAEHALRIKFAGMDGLSEVLKERGSKYISLSRWITPWK